MLEIMSNGSKWAGEAPDSIALLLDVLSREPLDPTFELYGNFIQPDLPESYIRNGHLQAIPGAYRFFGNFYLLSHVFRIRTDERLIIDALTAAIRANQQREDYQAARHATSMWNPVSVSDQIDRSTAPVLLDEQLDLFGDA